MTKSMEQSK